MNCVYCQKQTAEELSSCTHCGKEFPWSKEAKRLEDSIKVRETSRLRAAMTFFKDYQKAQKTGEPIPIASVKGLLNAWLFRSGALFIAIGALATTIFGGLQILLLCQQSKIMADQTEVMERQVDLETFGYLNQIKSYLQRAPIDLSGNPLRDYLGQEDNIHYWEVPPASDIANVVFMADYTDVEKVRTALRLLLGDRNSSIAVGALISLLHLQTSKEPASRLDLSNHAVNLSKVRLQNIQIRNVIFKELKLDKSLLINSIFDSIQFLGKANFEYTLLYNSSISNCHFTEDAKLNKVFITTRTVFNNCKIDVPFTECHFQNFSILRNNSSQEIHFRLCHFYDEGVFSKESSNNFVQEARMTNCKLHLKKEKDSNTFTRQGLQILENSSELPKMGAKIDNLKTW